ncbi:MAG TPA: YdbH domain-containing protein [Allosphingosinicella sp.]
MEEENILARRERRLRKRHVALGALLLLLLVLVIVWTQRTELATDVIRRDLERRGVRASYDVTRVGFRTQRLANVVIGDPARPDLTARFVEVKLPLVSVMSPDVQFITARGVRIFGRVVDGKLRLGDVDKLLPPPTGKPFALPDLHVDVSDVSLALVTPAGNVGAAIEGRGNLANGFLGKVAARSNAMRLGRCTAREPRAYVDLRILDRRPRIAGPLQAAQFSCGEGLNLLEPHFAVRAAFPETLGKWQGDGRFRAAMVESGINSLAGANGTLSFDGDPKITRGRLSLASAAVAVAQFRGSRMNLDGRYAFSMDSGELSLVGDGGAQGIVPSGEALGPVVDALASAGGTPLAPIGDALAAAVRRAGQGFDAQAVVRVVNGPGGGALRFETMNAVSRSGARLAVAGGDGLTYYWPLNRVRMDGDFALAGGGFPAARVSLSQPRGGAPMRGEARIAPMAAGGARLVLAPVRFAAAPGGGTSIETSALVDGPFNDGRVSGLLVPVSGRFGSGGGFAFGERCTTVSFRALQVASLQLGPARLPLCPTGPALVWKGPGGAVRGGAEIRGPRLAGRLGQSPIALAADRVRFALGDPGFTSANVAVRLGAAGSVNRLDLDSLSGRFENRGVSGAFAGGDGKLANVPLLLSEARGAWSVLGGDLVVNGAMTVADEVEPARFYPLATNDFRLSLIDNEIEAGGWLTDPQTGTRVTQVRIEHALRTGRGDAVLDVPGIRFDEDYQPEELTRLTTGVIALVRGTLKGEGRIGWGPEGATSTGTFSTEDMDLAATFGPVTGLTTTIRFTDLLGLVSAPGQLATVDQIQAGIDVFDGRIRYQLLPDLRARIEAGQWPFAGGELFLEETILDFSQPSSKRLTFRVVGLDAANFVQQMEFSNIAATGTFDGLIPMVFDQRGGRIDDGRLEARGEGTLSYVGQISDAALGTYGKLAFDALKSLRYSKFTIGLDGLLEGEFLANIELDGVARNTPDPGGIAGALIGQLKKIPFEFNIAIRGPFRALIATARSFEDPTNLIQTVLPDFLRDQPTTVSVQSEESENVK